MMTAMLKGTGMTAVLSVSLALGSVACLPVGNDKLPPPPGHRLTGMQSYNVRGQLQLTGGGVPSYLNPPKEQTFVLRVAPTEPVMAAGGRAEAIYATLTSADGEAFRAVEPIRFRINGGNCGSNINYTDFHFSAGSDGVTGVATGTAAFGSGDVIYSSMARLDFTGVPDLDGPSLDGAGAAQDPLGPLFLGSSEPLSPAARARLVAGAEQVELNPLQGTLAPSVFAFEKPPMTALRYDTTYAVTLDSWVDMAGNPGAPVASVTTRAAPPLLPEDGFEGAPAPVDGSLVVVDATVAPPITGARSALIGSAVAVGGVSSPGRLTARLAVQPGDRFVRFSMRPFSTFSSSVALGGTTRLAVPGGAIASVAPQPAFTMLDVEQTVSGGVPLHLGHVQQVEVVLPDGVTGEVIFDFTNQPADWSTGACGLPVPVASYLLDDLRVE